MRGVAGLAVRWPARRKGANPCQERSITDALKALPQEPGPAAPAPSFTARRPVPDRATRPIPGLAVVPAPAAAPARAAHAAAGEDADLHLLRRVRDAMDRKWRAEAFIADKKGLPVFAALTRELGWQGLHMPSQQAGWQRWSTGPWAARERQLADAAYVTARAQVLGEPGAVRARAGAGLHAAGGAG